MVWLSPSVPNSTVHFVVKSVEAVQEERKTHTKKKFQKSENVSGNRDHNHRNDVKEDNTDTLSPSGSHCDSKGDFGLQQPRNQRKRSLKPLVMIVEWGWHDNIVRFIARKKCLGSGMWKVLQFCIDWHSIEIGRNEQSGEREGRGISKAWCVVVFERRL